MSVLTKPETLVDVLRRRAAEETDRVGLRFLNPSGGGEPQVTELTYGELDAWARAVAVTLEEHSSPGDRVLLLCPPGLEYVAYFVGCLYARRVAVPAYPPASSRHAGRVEVIARSADARLIVAGGAGDLGDTAVPDGMGLLTATGGIVDGRQDSWRDAGATGAELALLQFTSGSTAEPKGVMVTHANLVANARAAEGAFGLTVDSVGMSWLPPYHDMGLIGGIVFPLYTGFPVVLMSPVAFLRDPARWLEAISRFRATVSPGPNFAYGMCCDRIGDEVKGRLDLSSWTCALNGSEPVRPEVLDRFCRDFERSGFRRSAFRPCYGLAEGTLLVSGARTEEAPKVGLVSRPGLEAGTIRLPEDVGSASALAGSGAVVAQTEVLTVDRDTLGVLPPGRVGEIWVRGPGVAAGYFRAEEATRQTFGATLATGEGPYLRTGDLGAFVEGELFVTGRAGDLMIFRGRNVYPQDVEATCVRSHPRLAGTRAAAFAVDAGGEERLVVVQELARRQGSDDELAELSAAIRRAVAEEHLLQLHDLLLVPPRKIPVTSSGKVQRKACRARYLRGEIPVVRPRTEPDARPDGQVEPGESRRESRVIEERIRQIIARLVRCEADEVDLSLPFSAHGLDSVHAVALAGELSDWLGTELPATFVWDHPSVEEAVRRLSAEAPAHRAVPVPAPRTFGEPVAVVGVGCRFPGVDAAAGADGFWDLLIGGRSGIGAFPADRWDPRPWFSPEVGAPGRMYARHGGFIDGVAAFDAGLFGVSPGEAASMDPQQRLALEVGWEALEYAGLAPDSLRGTSTGVFMGVGGSDFARSESRASTVDAYAATGGSVNFVANRLSYVLGLEGPSLAVDTACSSSLVALHLAVQSLRTGECDLALAGGVNVLLSPDAWVALCQGRMLSVAGRCRTFDARADGYVRGEGCGMVVLKRLPDARRDGDDILAVVRGTAVNHDGRSNGLTAPNGLAQQDVVRRALAVAGVAPSEVGYVEAHGTGTPLGDPVEIRALAGVLGEGRTSDRPLALGSVKTNIGHLEAAAGIAGFVKAVLTVRHGLIPPHLNLDEPNPHVAWDALPVTVPTRATEWDGRHRISGVSSFGFGGTNAHAVIEGAP